MLDTNKLIPNRSTKSSLSPVAMTNFIVLKTDLVKIDSILKESLIKEVFTICKTGKRSEKASRILSKFKIQSRSIEGGIEKVKRLLSD